MTKTASALTNGVDTGAYIGFLSDDAEVGIRSAYPEPTRGRLASVKATYDPANLFRLNHNVPPFP